MTIQCGPVSYQIEIARNGEIVVAVDDSRSRHAVVYSTITPGQAIAIGEALLDTAYPLLDAHERAQRQRNRNTP